MKQRYALILHAATLLLISTAGSSAQDVDRSQETSPVWSPPPTRNTDSYYPRRPGLNRTPFQPIRPDEVSQAANPRDAARRIDITNRITTPYDLDVYRKDGQPGVGINRLLPNPRETSADRTGRNLVETSLVGRHLNTDPRAMGYLRNAAPAMNMGSVSRVWDWGFGSERFIRISGTGSLTGSVGAATARHNVEARLVGTFFGKTRELGAASLVSSAPSQPTSRKTATVRIVVLGRPLVNETVSDTKPFVKNLSRHELAPLRNWWSGAITVPWINLAMAFKMNSDPVTVTPRVALGHASAAGEVALRSGLETLGDVPLFDLWGFASVIARIHFRPVDGQLIGGESVGLVWDTQGRPSLQDALFARTDIAYGAVNLKIKAVIGFKVFGFSLGDTEKTLWSVFKHDGHRSTREVLSSVRQTPLR